MTLFCSWYFFDKIWIINFFQKINFITKSKFICIKYIVSDTNILNNFGNFLIFGYFVPNYVKLSLKNNRIMNTSRNFSNILIEIFSFIFSL